MPILRSRCVPAGIFGKWQMWLYPFVHTGFPFFERLGNANVVNTGISISYGTTSVPKIERSRERSRPKHANINMLAFPFPKCVPKKCTRISICYSRFSVPKTYIYNIYITVWVVTNVTHTTLKKFLNPDVPTQNQKSSLL